MFQKITVTVPSTYNTYHLDGTKTSTFVPELDVKRSIVVCEYFTEMFGGATAVKGNGYYKDDNGDITVEPVTEVSSVFYLTGEVSDNVKVTKVWNRVVEWAAEWSQDCVMVTVSDCNAYFITSTNAF